MEDRLVVRVGSGKGEEAPRLCDFIVERRVDRGILESGDRPGWPGHEGP